MEAICLDKRKISKIDFVPKSQLIRLQSLSDPGMTYLSHSLLLKADFDITALLYLTVPVLNSNLFQLLYSIVPLIISVGKIALKHGLKHEIKP